MWIKSIALQMVFVLAWTIGDASSLSCQPLSQPRFLYSTTSSGIVTWSKCNTVISCGTTGKVAIMEPPISFGFMLCHL